ncbi:MAG: nicotinamide riboside transporter PnuC [Bacteroidota bacterium]
MPTPLEIVAALFSLVCVWLTVKRNIWCWPTAIIGVTAYFFVFYKSKLYSDMGLQVVFFIQSVYGWYFWLHGKKEDAEKVPIRRMQGRDWALTAATTAAMILILGWLSDQFTDTDVPYLDAAVASVSLIANLLMARKILENWQLWIAVDAVYVGLFLYKELYLTAVLYLIFFGMAIAGLYEWRKEWLAQKA